MFQWVPAAVRLTNVVLSSVLFLFHVYLIFPLKYRWLLHGFVIVILVSWLIMSQYWNLKIAMHFVYGQKLCHFLPIIRSFFVFILFLITEVLLLTDSKRRRFSPTKSFAHQVFTGKVFIFFILLFFIAGKTPYQRIER